MSSMTHAAMIGNILHIETENNTEEELDVTPTTKSIKFLLRDEVKTLAKALQIFDVSYEIYSIKLCMHAAMIMIM